MGKATAIVPINRTVLQPAWQEGAFRNAAEGRDTKALGVFSSFPTVTEKWSRHIPRKGDYANTMARMFIRIPPGDYDKFLGELEDPDTRRIATFLTGDDAGKGGVGYIDFLLQNALHQYDEKVQICETLSDNYVAFFFGTQAPTFSYRGVLFNTYQDDWTMRMFRIFRDLTRGTQLARRGLVMYLKYDSIIVQGAMTNFRYSLVAGKEMATTFDFNLLVKKVSVIYGALGPPTDLVSEKHFAPEGYHTDSSGTNPVAATNTYMSSPSAGPAGVSEKEPIISQTESYDSTGGGTTYMPDDFDPERSNQPPIPGEGVGSVPASDQGASTDVSEEPPFDLGEEFATQTPFVP